MGELYGIKVTLSQFLPKMTYRGQQDSRTELPSACPSPANGPQKGIKECHLSEQAEVKSGRRWISRMGQRGHGGTCLSPAVGQLRARRDGATTQGFWEMFKNKGLGKGFSDGNPKRWATAVNTENGDYTQLNKRFLSIKGKHSTE